MHLILICHYALVLKANTTEEEAFAIIRNFVDVNQYPIDYVEVTDDYVEVIGEECFEQCKRVLVKGRFDGSWSFPGLCFEFRKEDDLGEVFYFHERTDWGDDNPYSRLNEGDNARILSMVLNYFKAYPQEGGSE